MLLPFLFGDGEVADSNNQTAFAHSFVCLPVPQYKDSRLYAKSFLCGLPINGKHKHRQSYTIYLIPIQISLSHLQKQ